MTNFYAIIYRYLINPGNTTHRCKSVNVIQTSIKKRHHVFYKYLLLTLIFGVSLEKVKRHSFTTIVRIMKQCVYVIDEGKVLQYQPKTAKLRNLSFNCW
jgi:hypothetical protein